MVATPILGRYLVASLVASAPAIGAKTHALVVVGLGGETAYETAFASQGRAAATSATAAGAEVALLTGQAAGREGIREAIARIADAAKSSDLVVVQLIGHGSYDDEHYRFNVPGPDPTAADLAEWLRRPTATRRLAILATSASGAAIEPLQDAGVVVIAATRDGGEKNAVVFGRFWTEALADPGADTNKDGRIAADEAFRSTTRAVADHYQRLGRIATEHPRLEGSPAGYTLAVLASTDPDTPALAHLVARANALSSEVEALRAEKGDLSEDDYFSRLQELLLRLAQVERQLSEASGAPSGTADPKP